MRLLGYATLLSALGLIGCGGPDRTFVDDDGGSKPDTSVEAGDVGGDANKDTGTDAADTGDATPAATGKQAMDLVSGGVKMQSANYVLITTSGQRPGGNGVLKSSSYTLKGGVVGSTQP
jgi:hypothetical protein